MVAAAQFSVRLDWLFCEHYFSFTFFIIFITIAEDDADAWLFLPLSFIDSGEHCSFQMQYCSGLFS